MGSASRRHRGRQTMPVTNSRAVNLAVEVQKVWDEADAEERSLTPVERDRVETLIERAREAKALEEKLGELEGGVTWQHGDAVAAKGPGDQFIQSKGYKQLVERGFGSGQFSTGQVELQTKGTLVSTPGSALTPAGYVPGVVENLFQRPYLADLFPNREAPGNPVRYVAETTVTNAGRRGGRDGPEARIDPRLQRGQRAGQEDRHVASHLRRDARGRPADSAVPELAARALREAPGGGADPLRERARVLRVVDGDTIEVSLGGEIEDVRYLGVDTNAG